jgi:ABC-2 type transport system ATP-binding protein
VHEATIFGRSIHALVDTNSLDALKAEVGGASVERIVPSLEDVFVTLTYEAAEAAK